MADIDKVELEKRIDSYLEKEIPLSYLMEELNLTYPQIRLLINRAVSYDRKLESLNDNYQNTSYDNVSQDYIAIPHRVKEEYPFAKGDRIEVFKRLADLKNAIPPIDKDYIEALDARILAYEESLREFDHNEISKAEKIAQALEGVLASGENIEDILSRFYLTPAEINRLDAIFTNYLQTQGQYETLLQKREKALKDLPIAKKMKREIEDIREDIVTHNIKLVNFCIRYFFSDIPVDQEEMQLFGLEGLTQAINGFDYTKGYQFSTYAVLAIVHNIQRHFSELYGGYTWENYCRKEAIRYQRELYKRETGDTSIEVSARTLADSGKLRLTEKKIDNNDKLIDRVAPLSDVQAPPEDEYDFVNGNFPTTFEEYERIDTYTDASEAGSETLEEAFVKRHVRDSVAKILDTLPADEAQATILKFGLKDDVERSFDEIAKILNITDSRARGLIERAIKKLRHPSRGITMRSLLQLINDIENRNSMVLPEKTQIDRVKTV